MSFNPNPHFTANIEALRKAHADGRQVTLDESGTVAGVVESLKDGPGGLVFCTIKDGDRNRHPDLRDPKVKVRCL